jgi:hypothetical protein
VLGSDEIGGEFKRISSRNGGQDILATSGDKLFERTFGFIA